MGAAVDLDADLVLIAGDFFDNNRVKEPLVAETASIVGSTGKPVVILPGNHDPHMPGSMYDRFAHHFADHVHIFNDADGQLLTLDDVGVQIWGQAHTSYDDFSPAGAGPAWEDQLDPPLWRIAMAHGSAVGFDGRLSFGYRIEEEHLADLQAHYVALGHLDRPRADRSARHHRLLLRSARAAQGIHAGRSATARHPRAAGALRNARAGQRPQALTVPTLTGPTLTGR